MTATKSRAVGEMRRRFRAVVALAVLSLALAGCDSGSDRADGDEAVQMVDGLVCGVFDVDIVEAVVESDDYTASGTGVPEIGSAPDSGRIECSIGVGEDDFDHRVRFSASPIADKAEQTRVEAREAAALASSRQKIGEQGGHCFTSPTLDALGSGYVCRTDGRTQTRVVLPDRFVYLTLFGENGTDDAVVAAAVDLIENARGNLAAR
ncbi:hypothetical protein, partial [Mumia sp.]